MNWTAIWVTCKLASLTSVALLIIGLPIAYWLTFSKWRWKFLIESIVALPLVLLLALLAWIARESWPFERPRPAVSTLGYLGFLAGPPLVGGIAQVTSLPVGLCVVVVCATATTALAGATRGVGAATSVGAASVAEPARA